jgi:hypothetical protein
MNLLTLKDGKFGDGIGVPPGAPAGAVTLGFRPEDVTLAKAGPLKLEATTVDGVEPVGAESFLYCTAGGQRVVVRVSGRSPHQPGDKLAISAPPHKLHWFDKSDLGRILDTLSPGQRSVVESISVDGRSIGETAQALNMNETAVRVALHRGLKAIAARFGQ